MASHEEEAVENIELTDYSDGYAIAQFLDKYEKSEHLKFEKLTKATKRVMEGELKGEGIKYELYDRGSGAWKRGKAKAPESARKSIIRRQTMRKRQYESVEQIEQDMHDLAGIRIALYWPNDLLKIEKLINKHFNEFKPPQDWPDPNFGPHRYPKLDGSDSMATEITGRKSRFPGYFARHYRVQMRRDCNEYEAAMEGKVVEIQVMSLLMHTWSNMHYELIYKPVEGLPLVDGDDELLLDVSNGIIMAGEQVLRHIQTSFDKRQALGHLPFDSEQRFLMHLRSKRSENETNPSGPDYNFKYGGHYKMDAMLYRTLRRYSLNTPEKVDWLVEEEKTKNRLGGHLLIALARSDYFSKLETDALKLPPVSDDGQSRSGNRDLGRTEIIRLVRYYVWVINNAVQWLNNRSWVLKQCRRYHDTSNYPSGKDFLHIRHPNRQKTILEDRALNKLREFCESILITVGRDWKSYSDEQGHFDGEDERYHWMLSLSLARLTWYQVPGELEIVKGQTGAAEDEYERFFAACPKYFIDELNGDGDEESNIADVLMLPDKSTDGAGAFEWSTEKPSRAPEVASILGFEHVRSYIDRLDKMEY
ncbi:hypothetical protein GGR51DRAFT_544832 [Nemania sp. FL0031]|nr:hypothetical protein GGR51DRAFT_544832 [Nemania sp. FL0031]